MDTVSATTQHRASRTAEALSCIKRHLPTLRKLYAASPTRRTRLMLKEFEMLLQRSEQSSNNGG
jgi:hypothetical protein